MIRDEYLTMNYYVHKKYNIVDLEYISNTGGTAITLFLLIKLLL